MSDQYKPSYRQGFAWWDAAGLDIPQGVSTQIHNAFKAWERRRGFKTDDDVNPENPEPAHKLRGHALRAKLALENKKRMLAAEEKQAKKNAKKKLTTKAKPTMFAPDIVGKQYSSYNNAQRRIKQYIEKNYLVIPKDYEFGVNKIDWGCYEITGCRKTISRKKYD